MRLSFGTGGPKKVAAASEIILGCRTQEMDVEPVRETQESARVHESSFLSDILQRATFVVGQVDKELNRGNSTTLRIYQEASIGSLASSLLARRARPICGHVCDKG